MTGDFGSSPQLAALGHPVIATVPLRAFGESGRSQVRTPVMEESSDMAKKKTAAKAASKPKAKKAASCCMPKAGGCKTKKATKRKVGAKKK
jgi:hypothetical protein